MEIEMEVISARVRARVRIRVRVRRDGGDGHSPFALTLAVAVAVALTLTPILTQVMANKPLRKDGHDELMIEELIAGRLYTGPCCYKYNSVLRMN